MAEGQSELNQKRAWMRALLSERGLGALLLKRVSSFAWATGGAASFVNAAVSEGTAWALVTASDQFVITNNIEAARLEQEEKLGAQGWEFIVTGWHASQDSLAPLTRALKLGADGPYPGATDLSREVARLRARLTPEEGERFRILGRLCAEAMQGAIRAVQPGQAEHEIAGRLAHEAERRGVQAIVNLIASDARALAFRHPLPTDKRLERYAMLVLCGRRRGQVCSLTRFVHFGRLPDDLRRKAEAVAKVDAALIAATHPGQSLGDIFRRGMEAYAQAGFPDEWQHHHQGGPAGYEPREYLATPEATDLVWRGQVYAWNPSIAGTKSEDTLLVGEAENEVLTSILGWPELNVTLGGQTFLRPAILEIV